MTTAVPSTRSQTVKLFRFEQRGAWLALAGILCTFFGLSWDIQWHADVGPDTFWTLPHLFVYAGAAFSGLASLIVILMSTAWARRERAPHWISILGGRFSGAVGFVVSGFGALGFLLFGLFDQWWHLIYGFDVTLNSPPHIGLVLSMIVTMIGAALIFVQGRRVQAVGFVLSIAVGVSFALPVLSFLFKELDQSWAFLLFPGMFFGLALLLVASVTRNVWWVLGLTVLIAVFRTINWYGIPLADHAYASALGYVVKDDAKGFAYIPYLTPMLAPLAGLAVAAVLSFWNRSGRNVQVGALVAGALAAPLLFLGNPVIDLLQIPVVIPVIMLVTAAFGWLGWQLGVVLHYTNGDLNDDPFLTGAGLPGQDVTA